jgi:hypothetical protein
MAHGASEAVDRAVESLGLDADRRGTREWVVAVPLAKRGPLPVTIALGDRTAHLRAFILRRPDRNAAEIHERLLRRHLHMRLWRFALDDAGDLFAVADLPLAEVSADTLDGALGLLATAVDETYEGIVRTGFAVPEGTLFTPPPG